jgi:oligogalacturonide lyase
MSRSLLPAILLLLAATPAFAQPHVPFSVSLPEGTYKVTVKFGHPTERSDNTVRAELRRLMLEHVRTQPGQFITRSFVVNIRRPDIPGGAPVVLKEREKTSEAAAWDEKLSLEFGGPHPAVASVDVEKVEVRTIFLLGDSTVCDQPSEPWASWGQMLTRFLKPDVAVANHAESGESLAGALAAHRVDKVWSAMKPGDYLFIQFGHNDMKSTSPGALQTYAADMARVVDETRRRGGLPVLITSVSRRTFDAAGKTIVDSFNGYTQAVRDVARAKDVPLIDLQEATAALYEALGPDTSHYAFATMEEGTHHNEYGAYEIAKCVVMGIRAARLEVAASIAEDFAPFDPSRPDPLPPGLSKEPPREWIDPETGHRVVRLSDEPGSQSLYFHQNGYTPDGSSLVMTTPTGLSIVNLKTRVVSKVVDGRVNLVMIGRRTGQAYYVREGVVYAVDVKTREVRRVAKVPADGTIAAVNSDEMLLAGTITRGRLPNPPQPSPDRRDSYPGKGDMMERRLAARLPMELFVIDVRTGRARTILRSTDWVNHVQFSPTDPAQLLFCHEGPWHKVDRTWTIRADGTGLTLVHRRTMNMEIEGHEFFSSDGRAIWYDLQTPRGEDFWLASYELKTRVRTWYHLQRSEWSVHFNQSPDGALFVGDGGGPSSVAAPGNGQWIYLFRPKPVADRTEGALPDVGRLIAPGVLDAEKLVNLATHDYGLEPNATFTPDMKWVVFRSNLWGPTHVYAVEVESAQSR